MIDLVHEAAQGMAALVGFDEDDALNLGLAVREAVINAVLHGNRKDPSLLVEVTIEAEGDRLLARVTDQGKGFDPAQTPDPTAEANLLRNCGRGLLLMQAFVDTVEFRSVPGGGTEVTMIKRIPDTRSEESTSASS